MGNRYLIKRCYVRERENKTSLTLLFTIALFFSSLSFSQYTINWGVFIAVGGNLKNQTYSLQGISSPIAGLSFNSTYTTTGGVPYSPSLQQQATLTLTAHSLSPIMIRLSWNDLANEAYYTLKRDGNTIAPKISKDTTSYDDKGLNPEITYNYEIAGYDVQDTFIASSTTIAKTSSSKERFIPYHNLFYPNKGERVSVYYELDESYNVKISIYDLKGRLVKKLMDETKQKGKYWIDWDGRDDNNELLSSGAYIIQINAGSLKDAKKIILVR